VRPAKANRYLQDEGRRRGPSGTCVTAGCDLGHRVVFARVCVDHFRSATQSKTSQAYFFCSLLCASFTAASSASAAFTFTSGSTPVSAQSIFEKRWIGLVSGIPIPK